MDLCATRLKSGHSENGLRSMDATQTSIGPSKHPTSSASIRSGWPSTSSCIVSVPTSILRVVTPRRRLCRSIHGKN